MNEITTKKEHPTQIKQTSKERRRLACAVFVKRLVGSMAQTMQRTKVSPPKRTPTGVEGGFWPKQHGAKRRENVTLDETGCVLTFTSFIIEC